MGGVLRSVISGVLEGVGRCNIVGSGKGRVGVASGTVFHDSQPIHFSNKRSNFQQKIMFYQSLKINKNGVPKLSNCLMNPLYLILQKGIDCCVTALVLDYDK